MRKILATLLLVFGLELCICASVAIHDPPAQLCVVGAVFALMLLPWIARPTNRALGAINSSKSRYWIALFLAICSIAYLYVTARQQGRDFVPKWQDERMLAVQIQMMAHGRLWMTQHPLADFFEPFHGFVRPVYAGKFFPGTPLLYAPGIWLHLPLWVLPLLCSGIIVSLVFLAVSELIDPISGLIASLLLLTLSSFRFLSLTDLSEIPAMLMGLAAIWAALRWRATQKRKWLLLLGIFAGWAIISRPIEGLAYSIPAILGSLTTPRIKSAAVICAGLLPFAILQIIFNLGVTGSIFLTPHQLYDNLDQPQANFGVLHFDPTLRPASHLQQKIDLYDNYVAPQIQSHLDEGILGQWFDKYRLEITASAVPTGLVLLLLPLAFLDMRGPKWMLPASFLIFIGLYSFFPFYIPQFVAVLSPAILYLVILGAKNAAKTFGGFLNPAISMTLLAIAIAYLPQFRSNNPDEQFNPGQLREIDRQLANLPPVPAVVLFHYPTTGKTGPIEQIEPVYNMTTPNPDDARIILAHDLGPVRNLELFRYYSTHGPDRECYIYDRGTDKMQWLGKASTQGLQ